MSPTASKGHVQAHRHADRDRHHHPDTLGAGIDVSGNNGDVDWKKVKAAGKDEAIVKATEGRTFDDPLWGPARAGGIVKAGLRPGLYHFARPDNNTPEAECAHFLSRAASAGAKLIGYQGWRDGRKGWLGVLDFETAPFDPAWARDFAIAYKAATGHRPLLYGYSSSINPLVGELDHFAGVWLAAYVKDWKPYWHGPADKVVLWQYTDHGTCAGISGAVDLSKFLG